MRKINKIVNIALILIIVGLFLWQDFTWSLSDSMLRPPSQFSQLTRDDDVLVQQLIAEPIRTEEILKGLSNGDRKRLIDKVIAMLNQQFKKPTAKKAFKIGLGNYLTTLKILRIKGILRGLIIYPVIGLDVIPAQVGSVIGINNRRTYDFIKEDIRKNPYLYPGIDLDIIVRNLTYISGVDILDIDSVVKVSGHYDHIALIFKGMSWLRRYSFNPSWVKKAGQEDLFTKYLQPLCNVILKAGDDIILFDGDTEFAEFFINNGEYENIESGIRGYETVYQITRHPYNDKLDLSPDILVLGNKCVVLRKIKKEGIGEIEKSSIQSTSSL